MSDVPVPFATPPPRPEKRYPRLVRLEVRPPRDPCADAIVGMTGEELLLFHGVGGRIRRLASPCMYAELVEAGFDLRAEGVPNGGFIRRSKGKVEGERRRDLLAVLAEDAAC